MIRSLIVAAQFGDRGLALARTLISGYVRVACRCVHGYSLGDDASAIRFSVLPSDARAVLRCGRDGAEDALMPADANTHLPGSVLHTPSAPAPAGRVLERSATSGYMETATRAERSPVAAR